MNKAKRILAAIALAMALGAVSASAAAAQGPECPPDQHGNLGPGFKPAPCPANQD